jgi:hypothetical protein
VQTLTYRNVHGIRSRCDNRAHNKTDLTDNGHISTTKKIRKRPYERTECSIWDEVSNHEPCVSVDAADVLVDEREDGSEEVQGNLGADPEEGHAHQCHEQLRIHLS